MCYLDEDSKAYKSDRTGLPALLGPSGPGLLAAAASKLIPPAPDWADGWRAAQ